VEKTESGYSENRTDKGKAKEGELKRGKDVDLRPK